MEISFVNLTDGGASDCDAGAQDDGGGVWETFVFWPEILSSFHRRLKNWSYVPYELCLLVMRLHTRQIRTEIRSRTAPK